MDQGGGSESRGIWPTAFGRRRVQVLGAGALLGLWLLYLAPTGLGGPLGLIYVSGESMEPTLHTGDLAILYRQARYQVGDIVAFDIPEGGTVIHRVVRVVPDGYQFRGDNRNHDDPWTLDRSAIKGRQVLALPQAAHMLAFLVQPPVISALIVMLVIVARLAPKSESESEAESEAESTGSSASRPVSPNPARGAGRRRSRSGGPAHGPP